MSVRDKSLTHLCSFGTCWSHRPWQSLSDKEPHVIHSIFLGPSAPTCPPLTHTYRIACWPCLPQITLEWSREYKIREGREGPGL